MLNQDQFFAWLNPSICLDVTYNPARLLDPAAFVEVDEEIYWYFLGMLPPIWQRNGFAVSEARTQTYRNRAWTEIRLAFFKFGGRHFAGHITDQGDAPEGFDATRERIAGAIGAA